MDGKRGFMHVILDKGVPDWDMYIFNRKIKRVYRKLKMNIFIRVEKTTCIAYWLVLLGEVVIHGISFTGKKGYTWIWLHFKITLWSSLKKKTLWSKARWLIYTFFSTSTYEANTWFATTRDSTTLTNKMI